MAVIVGQGTVLKVTISSTLTAVSQVVEISGPSIETGTTETTNLASLFKSFRSQLPGGGEINATIQYDPADTGHVFLATTISTWPQAALPCEIDFPGGSHKVAFSAYVTKFDLKGMNQEDNLEADITLTVTGTMTFT